MHFPYPLEAQSPNAAKPAADDANLPQ